MDESMRKQIDEATPGLLKLAQATFSVNRIVGIKGERTVFETENGNVDAVYYQAPSKKAPLIISFHSGGFLFGGAALNDLMWTKVARELDINIASIDYRMSPKYKWRDSLADAYNATAFLCKGADRYDYDPDNIYLLGGSAGGNLAAAVCLKNIYDKADLDIKGLILLYPLLDLATEPALKSTEWYGGPAAYVMNEQHTDPEEASLPLVSPAFASNEDLAQFPETLCFVAEHDSLKHEGIRFTERIQAASRCYEMPEMAHCYFEFGFRRRLTDFEKEFTGPLGMQAFESGKMKTASGETLEIIKQFIREKKI